MKLVTQYQGQGHIQGQVKLFLLFKNYYIFQDAFSEVYEAYARMIIYRISLCIDEHQQCSQAK